MDITKLKRDPIKVQACLRELPDERLVCTKPVKIYIPFRFNERNLAEVGIDTFICGIYAMVTEDGFYAVSTVNAMIRIEPSSTLTVKINDEDYYEFGFDAGATVISSLQLVKRDILVYRIYDEIIGKGHVPWYLSYQDLGGIFDTAKYHANANVGEDSEVTELIVAIISRDKKDKTVYYRSTIESMDDLITRPPFFIPIKSVQYGATNTTNKLAGSYFSAATVSALVSPAERSERIETLLTT